MTDSISGPEQGNRTEVSFLALVNSVFRHRRLIAKLTAFFFILTVGITMIRPAIYTSSASFMPQSNQTNGGLTSGLAAQFGFTLPAADAGNSPAFYAALIVSYDILRSLAETTYTFSTVEGGFTGTLLDYSSEKQGKPLNIRREAVIRELEENFSVSMGRETGLVTFQVRSHNPELSSLIVDRTLELINQFNLLNRQSQAATERIFVEERLDSAKVELRQAEDALEEFLDRNRSVPRPPDLEFIHDRLQREVVMRQQVVTTLVQAFEQARIDEVRDTPVITVVGTPRTPVLADSNRLPLRGILALIVGLMTGFFLAQSIEFMQRSRQQDRDEFEEYDFLKNATISDLRKPWRMFLRRHSS